MKERTSHRTLRLNLLAMAALAVAAVATTGCGSKVEDCNKVIDVINSHADETGKIQMDKPEGLDAFAAVLDKTGTEISALALKDEQVKKTSADFAATNKGLAAAVREVGAKTKALSGAAADPATAATAAEDVKKASDAMTEKSKAREKSLEAFQGYCK